MMLFLLTRLILFCCRVSREMFRRVSSELTMFLIEFKHSGLRISPLMYSISFWPSIVQMMHSFRLISSCLYFERVVLQQFSNLNTVDEVPVDSNLRVLDELFVDSLVSFFFSVSFREHTEIFLLGVDESRSHRCECCFRESIDSESGVVCCSPSVYLLELFKCFSSCFTMCSEEKPGPVVSSMFTGRCTTSESSSEQNCLNCGRWFGAKRSKL